MSYLQMKFRGILKNGFPVNCIDESPSGASAGTLLLHRVNGACCVSVCVLNTYVAIMAIAECEKWCCTTRTFMSYDYNIPCRTTIAPHVVRL